MKQGRSTKRRKQQTNKKYFTADEANKMLPLVRVIVKDIVDLAQDLQQRHERLERLLAGRKTGNRDVYQEELEPLQADLERDKARMEEYQDELRRLGVELKGYDGLVDFAGLKDGREICLCWKHGEEQVAFWHEIEAGFNGRKPIATLAASNAN